MKKLFLFVIVALFAAPSVQACDACGCGAGGNYMGILPQFNSHFVGLKWNYRSFHTTGIPSILASTEQELTNEQFQTLDVWGRMGLGKRFQVYGYIPFQVNDRQSNLDAPVRSSGIGDGSAMINYTLFDNSDSLFVQTRYNWQLSGGVKAPTGRNSLTHPDGTLLGAAFQPGSKSWDYTLGSIFTFRRYIWGISADAFYRINRLGANGYTFGNRFNASAKVFYWKNVRNYTFLPNIGVLYERNAPERQGRLLVTYSGGEGLFATIGVENYFKRWSLGCTVIQPVQQRFSEGTVTANTRLQVSISFMIPRKEKKLRIEN